MRKAALIIPRDSKGLVLLQQKTYDAPNFPGNWNLFGGSVEEGESMEEAVVREYKEELARDFFEDDGEYFGTYGDESVERAIFLSRIKDFNEPFTLYEGRGLGYFNENEINHISMPPHIRAILQDYFSKQK